MSRKIESGIHWIQEDGPDRSDFVEKSDRDESDWYDPEQTLHIPQNAYLIDGEQSLLFDTLSPASTDNILDELREILDGSGLDYLAVSHPDVPHAGNTSRILEEYPEATLVAPKYGEGHELYHLESAMKVGAGDMINLEEHIVEFHEATFLDASLHMWMTEQESDMFFPVDWLGYPHLGSESQMFVDEFDSAVTPDRLAQFHGRVLFWLQYVDVEKTIAEIEHLISKYSPSIIAPAHGNVIRKNTTEYMAMMKSVVEQINEQGRIGTLG